MGNLRSVQKAFERLGVEAVIAEKPLELTDAAAMVLPGVGAFRDAIAAIRQHDLAGPIRDHIAADKPFLGICLGLQLLFDVSYEEGEFEGLGIVPGEVVRFRSQPGLRIPHMGWNEVRWPSAISHQPSVCSTESRRTRTFTSFTVIMWSRRMRRSSPA